MTAVFAQRNAGAAAKRRAQQAGERFTGSQSNPATAAMRVFANAEHGACNGGARRRSRRRVLCARSPDSGPMKAPLKAVSRCLCIAGMFSRPLRKDENAGDYHYRDDGGCERAADIQTAFRNRLVEEISDGCTKRSRQDEC